MSEKEKSKIMSLSLEPDMYELVKSSAKKMGHKNVSQMIRDLISKYLDLLVNDKDETAVIIRIPNSLKDNKQDLQDWLNIKAKAITDALT
jgi:metal-responsive CopG/Arc/MetJ family transcriptional regulator